jgi:hypothetical protein
VRAAADDLRRSHGRLMPAEVRSLQRSLSRVERELDRKRG